MYNTILELVISGIVTLGQGGDLGGASCKYVLVLFLAHAYCLILHCHRDKPDVSPHSAVP